MAFFAIWLIYKTIMYNSRTTAKQSDETTSAIKTLFHDESTDCICTLSKTYIRVHYITLLFEFVLNCLFFGFIFYILSDKQFETYQCVGVIAYWIIVYYIDIMFISMRKFFNKFKNTPQKNMIHVNYNEVYARYFNLVRRKRFLWIGIYAQLYLLVIASLHIEG